MAIETTPKCFVRTQNEVFYALPAVCQIDRTQTTVAPNALNIDSLIKQLTDQGPLVAYGKFGPRTYTQNPHLLSDQGYGNEIYYWGAGTERKEAVEQSIIVLGAKKVAEKAYVFFTMSQVISVVSRINATLHAPVFDNQKNYVNSYATFHQGLNSLHSPVQVPGRIILALTPDPTNKPDVSLEDREYMAKLMKLPSIPIVTDKEVKASCKAIGQEIFDAYKQASGGNSMAGKEAMQRICDAIHYEEPDGRLRRQYIANAWIYIGDDKWTWFP